ncbi:hypothetical protein ICN11_01325 [Polynucleobacter sp. 78F-HAINBA]|uniref:hypothetical protein n=1 Tax=Polynucleobacter sp. 78F-HAINBA TaxID=2689099 RepID=UPI001C0B68A0|nr:hypothetical protein [Polynucleobacter sp. 78F-HAINBA]MBU3590661.1 hypothetical protein [Polynucleobacter sp. 78F-HAINBA]
MKNQSLNTHQILELSMDEAREWPSVAAYILEVEKNNIWNKTHRNFTDWLVDISKKLSIHESNLWRYYRAGKYYPQLLKVLGDRGIQAPTFDSIANKISAENLDTLEKIERAAPKEVFLDLASRVVNSRIKRNELRAAWVAYRKVLDGKTARGIGVTKPRVERGNIIQAQRSAEAQVLMALNLAPKNWTGFINPEIFEVMPNLRIRPNDSTQSAFDVDAAILIQGDVCSPIKIGVVEIKSNNRLKININTLDKQRPYFDFQWIAFENFHQKNGIDNLPAHVGILSLKNGVFEVVRPALDMPLGGSETNVTAKTILAKLIRR